MNRPAPLPAVLFVTFICSIGTGVFWNGLSFVAEHHYHFSQSWNLILYAYMGAIYTIGAFGSGRLLRRLQRRLNPRAVLIVVLLIQGTVCLGPLFSDDEWLLWVAGGTVSYTSSVIWPLVESYLTAGRHGKAMRSAIGWFNLVWTFAISLALVLMAEVIRDRAAWAIGGLSGITTLALVGLVWFPARPGTHDATVAMANVTPTYPFLLRSARTLLFMSYLLNSMMSPILPYRFDALGVDVAWQPRWTSTWMIVRVVALAIMWRIGFWHGRWGTLLFGAATLAAGFALVVLGTSLPVMVTGFVLFGVGVGVVYYAGLYYALAVGNADVEAGGTHEGLIGLGYGAGPLAALLAVGPVAQAASTSGPSAIVAVAFAVLLAGAWPAVAPYVRSRSGRRNG